ncbi:MAG: hypothetical protein ABII25_00810 [bacterium]
MAKRICPFCKEKVKKDATICKFCRSELPSLPPKKWYQTWKGLLLLLFALGIFTRLLMGDNQILSLPANSTEIPQKPIKDEEIIKVIRKFKIDLQKINEMGDNIGKATPLSQTAYLSAENIKTFTEIKEYASYAEQETIKINIPNNLPENTKELLKDIKNNYSLYFMYTSEKMHYVLASLNCYDIEEKGEYMQKAAKQGQTATYYLEQAKNKLAELVVLEKVYQEVTKVEKNNP